MEWAARRDVPLCDFAQNSQPFGIDVVDGSAVDVHVLVGVECVERSTQERSRRRVDLAAHNHNRHVVDVKPVNLRTTIDQCHENLPEPPC